NFVAGHILADEALIVPFPTLAIYDNDKKSWSVIIKAWVYLPIEGKKLSTPITAIRNYLPKFWKKATPPAVATTNEIEEEKIDEKDETDNLSDSEEALTNPARLALFFVSNQVKVVTKSIINGIEHILQPSDSSGFIEDKIEISQDDIVKLYPQLISKYEDMKFDYEIQLKEPSGNQSFSCTIYLLNKNGISIISDFDDTIKKSNVLSKRSLIKHTFYSYFKPVDGMSDLYQKWYDQGAQFHYISASPYQLFPIGTVQLRRFYLFNSTCLQFFKAADTYKIEKIKELINGYPERRYICVGDSGELDPEVYGEMARAYPKNIVHIFIRDICILPQCLPTCRDRYEKAFENLSDKLWKTFKDPTEIETDLEEILKKINE
ncbi:unnamed protein product, partial [Didymodactylos carnosus]